MVLWRVFHPKIKWKIRLVTDFSPLIKCIERPVHLFQAQRAYYSSNQLQRNASLSLMQSTGTSKYPSTRNNHSSPLSYSPQVAIDTYPCQWACHHRQTTGVEYLILSSRDSPGQRRPWTTFSSTPRTTPPCTNASTWYSQRFQEISLTISVSKLQIGDTINFAGHTTSKKGIHSDSNMLKAIREFKRPSNKMELRQMKSTKSLHIVRPPPDEEASHFPTSSQAI